MRVATAYTYDKAIEALQKRQADMANAQTQLTTGKKVNLPSDDPIAAARAERALSSISRADANQRALEASRNTLNLAETSMADAVELMQQAREALVAAGNASYTDAERASVAKKLSNIRTQLLSVANREDGGDGFIFGGQGSNAPPFTDEINGVTYQGLGGQSKAPSTEPMNLSIDGQAVWLSSPTGNGVFETGPDDATSNQGSAWISTGSNPDPSASKIWDIDPTQKYLISFQTTPSGTTYTIESNPGGAMLTPPQPYQDGKAITQDGMSFTIKGAPANGDKFSIEKSTRSLSVFSALDNAIQTLTSTGKNNGVITQAVQKGISEMDSVLSTMQGARAEVGETLNRLDSAEGRISASKLAAQTERSNAEDLDMTSAISEFQAKQNGYSAALQSYAMVQKMSLFQYLNV